MSLITIITAALGSRAEFLHDTWASILASAPENWEFEWCIQEDGDTPSLKNTLPIDERIRYDANTVLAGPGATRNAALARANGEWFLNIDSDDFFTSDGMSTLTKLIDDHPTAIWVGGRAHDYMHETGEIVEFPDYLPDGLITPNTFMQYWDASTPVFPVQVAGAGMRVDVARALGGYSASPYGQDVALFSAAMSLGDGSYSTTPVYNYRKWPGQRTALNARTQWDKRNYERQRIAAMRNLNLRIDT